MEEKILELVKQMSESEKEKLYKDIKAQYALESEVDEKNVELAKQMGYIK